MTISLKKLSMLMLGMLILCSCDSRGLANPTKGVHQASIDWVDFVKLQDNQYQGLYNAVIADPSLVTEKVVGEVEFNVAKTVTNPSYRIQPGDAAYLDIGTKLYEVEDFEPNELIAAADEYSINGYRLYSSDDHRDKMTRIYFDDIAKHEMKKIEWYDIESRELAVSLDAEESKKLIEKLLAGTQKDDYIPPQTCLEPTNYQVVFYSGDPLGYFFTLVDDGEQLLFHSGDAIRLIDDSIRDWLQLPQQVDCGVE